tara:strand:+ start:357 stop:848 length:492 start_codon:yes stop_codon:yes gene_type:complete
MTGGAVVERLLYGDVVVGGALPVLGIDVTATTVVLGALASRDWRPMHHDRDFAIQRNGTRDIFLNTPNQAAWFERYVTDWTGPTGRLGRMTFHMNTPVFPGDHMAFMATVDGTEIDGAGCGWITLDVVLRVGDVTNTACTTRVALPLDKDDNPWTRRGDAWRP